jgi:hypothetical protein
MLAKLPAAVGVPEITPPVLIVRPVGKPVAVQLYGVVPPVAVTVVDAYATETCPLGRLTGVETTKGAGEIVTV